VWKLFQSNPRTALTVQSEPHQRDQSSQTTLSGFTVTFRSYEQKLTTEHHLPRFHHLRHFPVQFARGNELMAFMHCTGGSYVAVLGTYVDYEFTRRAFYNTLTITPGSKRGPRVTQNQTDSTPNKTDKNHELHPAAWFTSSSQSVYLQRNPSIISTRDCSELSLVLIEFTCVMGCDESDRV